MLRKSRGKQRELRIQRLDLFARVGQKIAAGFTRLAVMQQPLHCDLAEMRVNIHGIADAVQPLARQQGRAGVAEEVNDQIPSRLLARMSRSIAFSGFCA
jgi:hypothetical protein